MPTCDFNNVAKQGLNIFLEVYVISLRLRKESNPPKVFSGKGVMKICSKFAGEQLCRNVISVKLLFYQNTSGGLPLL